MQVREGAGVAGELNLASGQGVPCVGVPQLEGNDGACFATREPKPAAACVGLALQREQQVECSDERRRGGCVALRQAHRERIEQNIHHPRRLAARGRRARRLRRLAHGIMALEVARPHRGAERLQVRLTRRVGIEGFELSGRA